MKKTLFFFFFTLLLGIMLSTAFAEDSQTDYYITDLNFTNLQDDILSTPPSDSFMVRISLTTPSEQVNVDSVILSAYSSDDELIGFNVLKANLPAESDVEFSSRISIPKEKEFGYVKACVWDGVDTMLPLSDVMLLYADGTKTTESTDSSTQIPSTDKQWTGTLIWQKAEGVAETGFYRISDGLLQSQYTGYESISIDVEPAYQYRITATVDKSKYLALAIFYDENNNMIGYIYPGNTDSRTDYIKQPIVIPENTARIKVSTQKYYTDVPIVEKSKLQNVTGLFHHVEAMTEELKQQLPLRDKVIVNFGDSIFGNYKAPRDISTHLSTLTGATVYNCAFGGCKMAKNIDNWNNFSMYSLANAIVSSDFSAQDASIENITAQNRTTRLDTLKSIDFNQVDIVTIAYGTNDYTGNTLLDDETNPLNTDTFGGALRYSIETLSNAYPHLQIYLCTPTWRFWMDSSYTYTLDSDTRTNSKGNTLIDFVNKTKEIGQEYHIKVIDNYYNVGFNKNNRKQYFPEKDGTHPNLAGRELMARYIASQLF